MLSSEFSSGGWTDHSRPCALALHPIHRVKKTLCIPREWQSTMIHSVLHTNKHARKSLIGTCEKSPWNQFVSSNPPQESKGSIRQRCLHVRGPNSTSFVVQLWSSFLARFWWKKIMVKFRGTYAVRCNIVYHGPRVRCQLDIPEIIVVHQQSRCLFVGWPNISSFVALLCSSLHNKDQGEISR